MNEIPDFGPWTHEDRQIFGPYSNGVDLVHGDPLRIYRRLIHFVGGDLDRVLKMARKPADPREAEATEDQRYQATEALIDATIRAFDLIPFDPATGAGAKEVDVLNLLNTFLGWLSFFESRAEQSPTFALPTGGQPFSETARRAIASSLPSGSTSTG